MAIWGCSKSHVSELWLDDMFCLFLKPDGNDDHVTYTYELHFVLQSFETTSCNFTTHFIVYCLIYSAKYKPRNTKVKGVAFSRILFLIALVRDLSYMHAISLCASYQALKLVATLFLLTVDRCNGNDNKQQAYGGKDTNDGWQSWEVRARVVWFKVFFVWTVQSDRFLVKRKEQQQLTQSSLPLS